MIIHFKNDDDFKKQIVELIFGKITCHNDLSESELFDILKAHPDRVEPDTVNIYNPRKDWGWKHGTLKYFSSWDDYSLLLPESNKIIKDPIDELRSEDICIRANKTDILESIDKLEMIIARVDAGEKVLKREFTDELRNLKNLIKGE